MLRGIMHKIIDLLFPRSAEVEQVLSYSYASLRELLRIRILSNPHIISLFPYRHRSITSLIWELKYRENKVAAKLFAEVIAEEVFGKIIKKQTSAPILVIPMPISKERRVQRGYNQCELIVEELRKLKPEHDYRSDIVHKIKNTEHQTQKNRKERLLNIQGSFRVAHPPDIVRRQVIVLDDVVTTGSTLEAVTEELKNAGTHSVTGISLAY